MKKTKKKQFLAERENSVLHYKSRGATPRRRPCKAEETYGAGVKSTLWSRPSRRPAKFVWYFIRGHFESFVCKKFPSYVKDLLLSYEELRTNNWNYGKLHVLVYEYNKKCETKVVWVKIAQKHRIIACFLFFSGEQQIWRTIFEELFLNGVGYSSIFQTLKDFLSLNYFSCETYFTYEAITATFSVTCACV